MATYVIGDIQGCYLPFQHLLEKINFNSDKDVLWFTGDLVNRGPNSLEVLRWVKAAGDKHQTVLGNHDLHLLAFIYGKEKYNPSDTLELIKHAPDKIDLIEWLRHRPIFYHEQQYLLSHAGIAPMWTLTQVKEIAHEIEAHLRGDDLVNYLSHMYGNKPDRWEDDLTGMERLRCATNYLTRMRFCYPDGRLQLTYKGTIADAPLGLIPWFQLPRAISETHEILFGHWAALGGVTDDPTVHALDTGCVWGNALTAMRLDDHMRFTVSGGIGLSDKI